jgi:hypothetical protein
MRGGRALLHLLVIALCAAVLLVAGYQAIVHFEQTHISVPLMLVAIVCAAVIAGTIGAMFKRPR